MEGRAERPLLVVVCGPTAVGKSSLALELAQEMGGEIISGDSAQVYRYMDIGTAKPGPEERRRVPHHLIDIRDPDQRYSVADFRAAVDRLVPEIAGRGRIPLLVGGSMLYIRSVTAGFAFPEDAYDADLRARLYREAQERGSEHLHERLRTIDPEGAGRIRPRDLRRVVRAWEVYLLTGEPISAHAARRQPGAYDLLVFGLVRPRPVLYSRIEERVHAMLAAGLEQEVRELLSRGYHPGLASMRMLGYKEMVDYLYGRSNLAEATRLLVRNTRRFARRQLTWMRREQGMTWIDLGEDRGEDACQLIRQAVAGKPGVP